MSPHLPIYRIYNDALAIVVNVKTRGAAVLRGEALAFWKAFAAEGGRGDAAHPVYRRLASLGILPPPADEGAERRFEGAGEDGAQAVDLAAINYWAFKNHIPLSGHFELTAQCNLRCRHCYCVFSKRDTLSAGQVVDIVDELHRCGTLGLVLTGGEIFFRKDILEILEHLHRKGFILRLNTNGTLIDEKTVQALRRFDNIYRIHVSVYGERPEVHDAVVNSAGAFRKTVNALHLLKEAGFDLRINCSVMRSNYAGYRDVEAKLGDRLDIPVHYDATIYPRDDGSGDNLAERIDGERLREYARLHVPTAADAPPKPKLCKAGFSFFSICEDGALYPCLKMKRFYENPLGNAAQEAFGTLWRRSETVGRVRGGLENKLRECDICDLSI